MYVEARPMTPQSFRRRIKLLNAGGRLTGELERAIFANAKRKPWYRTQKEHWLGWLAEYGGPGYYGRTNSNRRAEIVYNHINCAPMVFWLAEASHVQRSLLLVAKRSALRAGPSYPRQTAAIRRLIPWAVLAAALVRKTAQ